MLAKPRDDLTPASPDFERHPFIKATGFREYDARWRYLDEIKLHTIPHWVLPMDSNPSDTVKFKLKIDHAGAIALLEIVESDNPAFAESARQAILAASPFPPLDDNVRCLTERTITPTFSNPERS